MRSHKRRQTLKSSWRYAFKTEIHRLTQCLWAMWESQQGKPQCSLSVEKQTGWPRRVKLETVCETGGTVYVSVCVCVCLCRVRLRTVHLECAWVCVHSCIFVCVRLNCEMIVCPQINIHVTQHYHFNSHLFQLLDKCEQNRSHCLSSELHWVVLYLPCCGSYMWLGLLPICSGTVLPFLNHT